MDTMRVLLPKVLLVCAAVFLAFGARAAIAQEVKISFEIMGFNKDNTKMLVKIDDNNEGLAHALFDVPTAKRSVDKKDRKLPKEPFEPKDRFDALKKARKKHKIVDEGVVDNTAPDGKITIFGVTKKENLVIACTDLKRLGKVMDVAYRVDQETQATAKAQLKQVVWAKDGRTVIFVVTQKMTGAFTSERDELWFYEYDPTKILWVE